MFGFGGETDTERTIGACGDAGQNVRVTDHLQDKTVAACRVFLEFLWGDDFRAVIRDRCRGDENVAGDRGFARGEHVAGADHVDARDAVRRRQMHRAGD
ncbi:hypothetical protein D3C84_1052180 [compost metagenome]